MTEPTPEPTVPEPTELERVAQLAAEAATRAVPDADGNRLAAVEQQLAEILQALTAAAGPDGNAARLAARLAAVEQQLAELTARPPEAHPEHQKIIDGLRLRVAILERKDR